MCIRRAIAVCVALVVALAARRAHAWTESHQTGDDERVVIDGRGMAYVRQALRWRVLRGPLHAIDLKNFDLAAVVEPAVAVAADDGRTWSARATRRDERTVRITVDDPHALARGDFTFDVRWRIDLVAVKALSRDGGTWRLAWSAPAAVDGFDNARAAFELPAAPEEPRPIAADSGVIDDGAVATLRRGPQSDVLELVRPHVARGESVTWTVRVDGHALPLVVAPHVHPPPDANAPAEHERLGMLGFGALLAALALGFGWMVQSKTRAFVRMCAQAGERARGLLPLPHVPRAALAGVAFALAVGLEVVGETVPGAACASFATLSAALRAPSASHPARGPGRWQAITPEQAFARAFPPGHWLDIGSGLGRASALGGALLVVIAALIARRYDAEGPWLVALDAAAFVPLFVTGRSTQLLPHGFRSAAPWLAAAFRRLRLAADLHIAPWARVAPDGAAADELRLLVMPLVPMPGVIGLEVGLAWSNTPVCWTATPEVLARVLEGSAAAGMLARELPSARAVPGRRPDERVVRLLPAAPTRSSTAALVRALTKTLTDRRALCDARPSSRRGHGPIERRAAPKTEAVSASPRSFRDAAAIAPVA